MEILVTSAKRGEKPVLANLLNLYLHDFSEFDDVSVEADGRFTYPFLDHYWEDPNRYPFLIRVDGTLAGFALVRVLTDPRAGNTFIDMTEFFVLRRFRRQGVGGVAACRLWDLFVGTWEVRVLAGNIGALPFWRGAIDSYAGGDYVEEVPGRTEKWTTFRFMSGGDVELPDDLDDNILDY